MQIQRLVDLEDYEFDTLLVTYNHKNRLSIELGKVSEIFESLQADGLVGGSKVYGLRGKDFSYQGQPYYNLIFIGIPEKATPRRFQLQFGQAMKEAKRFHGKNLLMTAIGVIMFAGSFTRSRAVVTAFAIILVYCSSFLKDAESIPVRIPR